MKAIVKVSQLVTDDGKYYHGDMLDLTKEQINALGSSVEQIIPTVTAIDERDAKIVELEAMVKSLESEIATKNTTIGKMETEISAMQKEIKKRLKGK